MKKKHLVIDTANLLFRVASAHGKYGPQGTPEEKAGLAMHISLNTINKFYKLYRPDEIAVTFEGAKNWRKDYTRSAACHSGRVYKANRVKDDSMIPFFELIKSFEDLARNHTSITCLSHPTLEGDDLFGGYVQKFAEAGDEVVGVSGDKDFVQLLKYPNFKLINPDDGKPRLVDDAEFFIYEKCFRGDSGDNVISALPRVLKTRLIKSLTDDYEYTRLMNETWTFTDPETQEQKVYETRKLFEENKLLMDLSCQPPEIKKIIQETIESELANRGKFSFFQFTKFCGKFGLKQIADNGQQFADLFSATGKQERREEVAAQKGPVIKTF